MEYMSLFVGSEALALTLVMLTMKQDFVSLRFRLSGSKNRNVATTIVWQICGDMGMVGIIEAPGTVCYYVRLKIQFFTSAPLSD